MNNKSGIHLKKDRLVINLKTYVRDKTWKVIKTEITIDKKNNEDVSYFTRGRGQYNINFILRKEKSVKGTVAPDKNGFERLFDQ